MVVLGQLILEEDIRIGRKVLPNGDVYIGDFEGQLPQGKGKYIWSEDGTVYDGEWEEGKMTGDGQMLWAAGAKYAGEFSGGYIHGTGTFTHVDGSEYRGCWRMNIRHGVGTKKYSNLDVYEGSWKEGVHEGNGKYTWSNGNVYVGNWKGGIMNGRGIMKLMSGEIFDGSWSNGLRHGSGVCRFEDGGFYLGIWTKGLKDGKGTFYPAGTKHPSLKTWCELLGYDDIESSFQTSTTTGKLTISGRMRNRTRRTASKKRQSSGSSGGGHSGRELIFHDLPSVLSRITEDVHSEVVDNDTATTAYEREYMQGVLVKEKILTAEPSRKTKHRNRFSVKDGKTKSYIGLFRRSKSYYLMLDLQLGIRYIVGKMTPVPMREVRPCDFRERARIHMYFPRNGSRFTPPHYSSDFYWKDYCPMVFRNLREMFKLDAADYMMSICGDDGLTEISSPGKSGSIFYLSHDDRFVIKTLSKSELKTLLKMLPQYYAHVGSYENTLITKFFGVHRIKLRGGRKVRFVVMGNMFCTELRIHRRYDLKGSSYGRYTHKDKMKEGTTFKDLDLDYQFHMDKLLRQSLFKQLDLDAKFLESQNIIDYSLLLGLHFRAPEQLHQRIPSAGEPPKGLITAPGPHIRGSTLKAYSVGEKEVDLLLPGTARLRVQLGVNMPSQANRNLPQEEAADVSEVDQLFEVYDVVLYMGVIDILQEYNARKKAEHAYKSIRFDSVTISVVEPHLYSNRFIDSLQKVFPDTKPNNT
ncbi:Phosphatidylinositol 4-phosphate 5-kinase 8 [Linum grandiflorum]